MIQQSEMGNGRLNKEYTKVAEMLGCERGEETDVICCSFLHLLGNMGAEEQTCI